MAIDPFKYTEKELLELMHSIGNARFGSPCKHERVKGGYCQVCFRKVIKGGRKNEESIN